MMRRRLRYSWLSIIAILALSCGRARESPTADDVQRRPAQPARQTAKPGKPTKPSESAKPSKAQRQAVILANQGDQIVELDPNGAIDEYKQAAQLDPDNHRILYKLAKAYKKKEDWAQLESTLLGAVEIAPDHAEYWLELGYAQEQRANSKAIPYDACKASYKTCIERAPAHAGCHRRLAAVLSKTGDDKAALLHYEKSAAAKPDNILTFVAWADALLRLDRVKEALAALAAAQTHAKPSDQRLYGVHLTAARAHLRNGDADKQISSLEQAKQLVGGRHPELLFELGRAYAELKPPRKAEALQMLKGFLKRACRSKKSGMRYETECKAANRHVKALTGP